MKAINVTIVLMLFCQAVVAQSFSAEQIAEKKVQQLDDKVSLTENQKVVVSDIFKESATQMQSLKQNKEANKEAFQNLKKEEREKVKAVLSSEQLATLKEARKAEQEQQKASRDKIKDYHKTNVKPVLEAKRKAFDARLTASEKEIIAQAKAKMPKHKKGEGQQKHENGNKEDYIAARQEMKVLLKPVVDTHKAELKQIFEDVKPTLDAEKEYVKANKLEQSPKKGMDAKHKKGAKEGQKGDGSERFMYRFLLMD